MQITTNRRPYSNFSDVALILQIGKRLPPASGTDLPEHDGICSILKQCWEGDPGGRPAISECRDQLLSFV